MLRLAVLALLLVGSACASGPALPSTPPIERAERARYAADTTDGRFAQGSLRQQIVDVYNEQGNVAVSEYRNADGALQMRFVNTYTDGLKTRVDWRREDGSLALYVLNTYDAQDRLTESIQYGPDGSLRRSFRNRWSDDGLRRETGPIPAADEPFEPDSFFRLNALGEDVELLEFPDVDSLRTTFTYDYPERDAYENWTLRRTQRDGVPSQIETRRLIYRSVR
ncbi:MAG: hypothetical protein AAF170_07975 [Bacteroidota bacterium]